LFVGILRFVTL